MPTFEEARRLILHHARPVGTEEVGIAESFGRVIAEVVVAPWNLPSYDNSAMDGYAVRSEDCREAVSLRITGCLAAGALPKESLESGSAIKIMTGAPIPPGADAVVPFEEAEEIDGQVLIKSAVQRYKHIRRAGEDVCSGEKLLEPGTNLHPAAISMLASCGKSTAMVYRRPRVAILSIGDELVEVGESVTFGHIVNSNGPSLAAAVAECGAVPVLLGIARDNHADHREKIVQGLSADAFITSAGVSAGARDLVREVLDELGIRQVFSQIDMRPGSPTSFYIHKEKPVFCLPGNPVASLVAFEELVRPALRKMLGFREVVKIPVSAILQEPVRKKPGSVQLMRVQLVIKDGQRLAYSAGNQNTGVLKTLLRADGLALLPAERTQFSPGDEVQVHFLSEDSSYQELDGEVGSKP